MNTYKIKLEDKAAFVNSLEGMRIEVSSYKIIDNIPKGYFEFIVSDPITKDIVKQILKKSPKINTIKEITNKTKLTRNQLVEIIREELNNMNK